MTEWSDHAEHTPTARSRRVGRSVLWVVSEKGGVTVIALASVALLARMLSPDQIGVAAIGLTLTQFLTALIGGPLHDAVVQRKDCQPTDIATAFWLATGCGVVFAALGFLYAPALGRAFGDPRVGEVYAWMGLSLVAAGVEAGLAAPLRRALHFRPIAICAMVSRCVAAAVAVGLAFAGYGVWSLVAQQLVAVSVGALLLAFAVPSLPGFRFSRASARWQLRYIMPTLGAAALFNLQARIVILFVGQVFGATVLGYVHVAQRVVQAFSDFASAASYQLVLPLMARHQGDSGALASGFRRATGLFTAAVLPLLIGVAAVAPDVIGIAFGTAWQPAILPLQLLALSLALAFIRQPGGMVFQAAGRPGYNFASTCISFTVTLAGLLTFGHLSLTWTLAILVLRPIVTLPIGGWMLRRITGLGLAAQLQPACGPLLASAAMAAAVLIVTPLLGGWPPMARLAALVALGAAAYLPLLCLLAPATVKEGEMLARSALRPAAP
jgi:O-antigen/teichoic acid export membrane protein